MGRHRVPGRNHRRRHLSGSGIGRWGRLPPLSSQVGSAEPATRQWAEMCAVRGKSASQPWVLADESVERLAFFIDWMVDRAIMSHGSNFGQFVSNVCRNSEATCEHLSIQNNL